MATTVEINDTATPVLKDMLDQLEGKNVNAVLARKAVQVTQKHLFDFNASHPNKLGGKRTNFYSHAAKMTSSTLNPDGFTVSINQAGMRQRYEGEQITAGKNVSRVTGKLTRMLTIPACAEAYGFRAFEIGNLEMLRNDAGKPFALAAKEGGATTGRTKKKQVGALGKIMFWLAGSVNQKGDKSVLPDEQTYYDAFEKQLADMIARAKGGPHG